MRPLQAFVTSLLLVATAACAPKYDIGSLMGRQLKAVLIGTYDDPPVVILCNDSSVSIERLVRAVKHLTERCHQVRQIALMTCPADMGFVPGAIVIRVDDGSLEANELGRTWLIGRNNSILGAVIIFRNEVPTGLTYDSVDLIPWLVEHELYHAFGFDHFPLLGHIMASSHDTGGPDDSFLDVCER